MPLAKLLHSLLLQKTRDLLQDANAGLITIWVKGHHQALFRAILINREAIKNGSSSLKGGLTGHSIDRGPSLANIKVVKL
jgi:hypothetical protein